MWTKQSDFTNTGPLLSKVLLIQMRYKQLNEPLKSYKTKNKKLRNLLSKNLTNQIKYSVPVVKLRNNYLTEKEHFGLEDSFVDKNKHIKKNLVTNLEVVAEKVMYSLDKEIWEYFHEFLRAHTDILTKNVYSTKDDTYNNLKRVINGKTLAVVPGDKDSCVIIMKRADYIAKMQAMIDNSITCDVYTPTRDNTQKDLKSFYDFLYYNFKDHPKYEQMLPTSNQPGQWYGTAKTHKFAPQNSITSEKLKFQPIIAQTGTHTYNAAQVIAEYLKLLADENCNM